MTCVFKSRLSVIPRSIVLIGFSLVLTACTTLGPDYEEPEITWLEDWQPDLYKLDNESDHQVDPDLQFWWQLFNDPILTNLIETAKRENLNLQLAGLRILESRAALGIANSNRYPQLQQLVGGTNYILQSEGDDQNFANYQAGFNLGWELDFWGRFQRGIESADATFFASIANQQDVQVLLSAQMADLYFSYQTTLMRIRLAQQNAAIQQRSLEITQKRFENGQDSELDLQQATTQYLSTVATIPQLEILSTQIRNAMTVLLARPPGAIPELDEVTGNLPAIDLQATNQIPTNLLLRRPDVRVAAWQVAAQSAQIGIAEADYYPSISLLGSIGWAGNTQDGSQDLGTLSVGPAIQWNLFDYGRISNNIRLQDVRLQQRITSFQGTVLSAAREVDDAVVNVLKTNERRTVLIDSVVAANRSLELAQTRYQEGYSNFQRVLEAQRSLFSLNERELVNAGDHISSIIDFYKALGGGWLETPIEDLIPANTRMTMESRTDWGDLLSAELPQSINE